MSNISVNRTDSSTVDAELLLGLKGDKGDTGAAAGFGTVTATIDDNVGTPSVTVTASGDDTAKDFDFAFSNMKGDQGDKGDTGDPAGFGTVSATVDGNHGVPAVIVTASGDDTAKNFAFAFSNLQPAPYDDSALQSSFATLQSQFDTAVAAVTVDSEVADIRVGADGVTYNSAGAAVRGQLTDLKSDLTIINNDLYDVSEIAPYNVSNGWKLLGTGLCATDNAYRMRKFAVVAGQTLLLALAKESAGVYQWQNQANVPDSGVNSGLIGDPVTISTHGFVVVPTGATSLIVSELKTNTSNQIGKLNGKTIDSIEAEITEIQDEVTPIKELVTGDSTVCTVENGTLQNTGNAQCVYTSSYIPVINGGKARLTVKKALLSQDDYYRFGWELYDANKSLLESVTVNGGNTTGQVEIPNGVAFIRYSIGECDSTGSYVVIRKSDFATDDVMCLSTYPNNLEYRIEDIEGRKGEYLYSGEKIDHEWSASFAQYNWNMPAPSVAGASALQGIALYDSTVFQFTANNKCICFPFGSPTNYSVFDATCGHGNSADFSETMYDASDTYPLCYVSDWLSEDSNKVYALRLTASSAVLAKTYTFPFADSGYYAGACLDNKNKILYLTGYAKPNASENIDNENYLIVSAWDMEAETDRGNGTYTLAKINSFVVPTFVTTMQDRCFKYGKIFVLSSPSGKPTTVYAINPVLQQIVTVISDFPQGFLSQEVEGMKFLDDKNIFFSYRGQPWKMTF